ncbi:ogr/Delta-like zinc finger family protein, partial [Salmonella enterica]|nr:hypothetical protein [Salmonella enterica]ECK3210346.1 hypothetical protein [Salmonella enterica]EDG2725729.1 hypothetical protein [Salmonella enterica]EJA4479730.1 ogr/Delta-like zinc finger family protein [Salmonella enterica]
HMSRQIHIFCPECGERSTISKVIYSGVTGATLTCRCNNLDCGHIAVWECEFAHTVKSPMQIFDVTERQITPGRNKISQFVLSCTNCGRRATITRTARVHDESYVLYVRCSHSDCQHRFVSRLNFKNAVVPGAGVSGRLIQDIIKYLPASERQNVIDALREAGR